MPSKHGLTVSGTLSDPGSFGAAIAAYGRRSVAARLRRQGEQALVIGQGLAGSELKPSRVGKRRRDHGVSYRNGFEVEYTGLDDFAAGIMRVSVRNRSRHARVLEVGAKEHSIEPKTKRVLSWPAAPYNVAGPPVHFAKKVTRSGFEGKHILEKAALQSMRQGFLGQTLGHAQIRFTYGRRR